MVGEQTMYLTSSETYDKIAVPRMVELVLNPKRTRFGTSSAIHGLTQLLEQRHELFSLKAIGNASLLQFLCPAAARAWLN
jgi:hypothetical protein